MRNPRIFAFSLLILFFSILLTGDPRGDEDYFWNNPDQIKVPDSEMAFTAEKFKLSKTDSFFTTCRFNDGRVYLISLFGIKYSFYQRWGIYVLLAEPGGTSRWITHEFKNAKISYQNDSFSITDGLTKIYGGDMEYHFDINIPDFQCSLTYSNILPPWKPVGGRALSGDGGRIFQNRICISPWADVTGSITSGGETIAVSGQGYTEKALTVMPASKLNPYIHAIRVYSPEETGRQERWFINLHEFLTHEDLGSRRINMLCIANNDEWVLTTQDFTIRPADFIGGSDFKYTYPSRVVIKGGAGDIRFDGEFICTELFHYLDIIDELPFFIRPIVLLFVDRPVYFRNFGELRGRITLRDGTVKEIRLFGTYEYIVVK